MLCKLFMCILSYVHELQAWQVIIMYCSMETDSMGFLKSKAQWYANAADSIVSSLCALKVIFACPHNELERK